MFGLQSPRHISTLCTLTVADDELARPVSLQLRSRLIDGAADSRPNPRPFQHLCVLYAACVLTLELA